MSPAGFWNRYWFRPAPLLDLAVLRIAVCGYQVFYMLYSGFPAALDLRAGLPDGMYDPLPILRLLTLPLGGGRPPIELLSAILWITVAAGVLACVGLWTRVSLVLLAAGSVFIQSYIYSYGDFHHPEAVLLIALSLLALAPAGGALSVDDLARRRRANVSARRFVPIEHTRGTSPFARWPLLMVRWLLALAYLSSTFWKLRHGIEWMNGYTLQHHLIMDGLRWGSAIGVWLGQYHGLAIVLSWVAVIFQATFFLAVLRPRLAWIYLPLGIAFHLGIYVTQRAPFFQYMFLYVAFIPVAAWVGHLAARSARRAVTRIRVLYDGLCPLCVGSMTLLDYVDWRDQLELVDIEADGGGPADGLVARGITREAARREMHVILPDGQVHRGFFAFRVLSRRVPLLWPLALLTHLPGASLAGPIVYRRVAASRARWTRCEDGECVLHGEHASG